MQKIQISILFLLFFNLSSVYSATNLVNQEIREELLKGNVDSALEKIDIVVDNSNLDDQTRLQHEALKALLLNQKGDFFDSLTIIENGLLGNYSLSAKRDLASVASEIFSETPLDEDSTLRYVNLRDHINEGELMTPLLLGRIKQLARYAKNDEIFNEVKLIEEKFHDIALPRETICKAWSYFPQDNKDKKLEYILSLRTFHPKYFDKPDLLTTFANIAFSADKVEIAKTLLDEAFVKTEKEDYITQLRIIRTKMAIARGEIFFLYSLSAQAEEIFKKASTNSEIQVK